MAKINKTTKDLINLFSNYNYSTGVYSCSSNSDNCLIKGIANSVIGIR